MLRLPVTHDEMRDAIQAMHLAVPKYGLTGDTMPQVVRIYREALEGFDGDAVRGAAKMLLRKIEKFPTPNMWHDACRDWLKHNRPVMERQPEVDSDDNDIACRICRAVPRWAWLKMHPTPFSAALPDDRTMYAEGAIMRRIAPCDADRHHGGPYVPKPENFLGWVS